MIKTFAVLVWDDKTWSGGGVINNDNYLNEMDKFINDYSKLIKKKVVKIDYSFVNEKIPHGEASHNIQYREYYFASVLFT